MKVSYPVVPWQPLQPVLSMLFPPPFVFEDLPYHPGEIINIYVLVVNSLEYDKIYVWLYIIQFFVVLFRGLQWFLFTS